MLKFIMQLWIVTFMSIAFIIIAMTLGGKDQQYIIDSAMFVTVILIASNIVIDTVLLGLHILFKNKWKELNRMSKETIEFIDKLLLTSVKLTEVSKELEIIASEEFDSDDKDLRDMMSETYNDFMTQAYKCDEMSSHILNFLDEHKRKIKHWNNKHNDWKNNDNN